MPSDVPMAMMIESDCTYRALLVGVKQLLRSWPCAYLGTQWVLVHDLFELLADALVPREQPCWRRRSHCVCLCVGAKRASERGCVSEWTKVGMRMTSEGGAQHMPRVS